MEMSIDMTLCREERTRIAGGALEEVATALSGETEAFLVYDRNAAWVAERLQRAYPFRAAMALDTSEEAKTLETVLEIERWLLEQGASRRAFLVAAGGGITTDLTGLAACLYKRGIRYGSVPTTLLAQVDAAIGGKTGVNLDGYKNMLGIIRQPSWTLLAAETLRTLPRRVFLSGAAELLKTFLLEDAGSYVDAVRLLQDPAPSPAVLSPLIFRAAAIKARIVEADPFEAGERRKLNLGHTFAHALEHQARLCGDDLSHGEAVAIGMVLAARLSDRTGLSEDMEAILRKDFTACGLPVDSPYSLALLGGAMEKDKKAEGALVHFVLPVRPGEVVIRGLGVAEVINQLVKL